MGGWGAWMMVRWRDGELQMRMEMEIEMAMGNGMETATKKLSAIEIMKRHIHAEIRDSGEQHGKTVSADMWALTHQRMADATVDELQELRALSELSTNIARSNRLARKRTLASRDPTPALSVVAHTPIHAIVPAAPTVDGPVILYECMQPTWKTWPQRRVCSLLSGAAVSRQMLHWTAPVLVASCGAGG